MNGYLNEKISLTQRSANTNSHVSAATLGWHVQPEATHTPMTIELTQEAWAEAIRLNPISESTVGFDAGPLQTGELGQSICAAQQAVAEVFRFLRRGLFGQAIEQRFDVFQSRCGPLNAVHVADVGCGRSSGLPPQRW